MPKIRQLIYRSFASRDIDSQDIANILEAARKTNPGLNITGMLVYRNGIFFQIIEGSKENIEFLYNKIARDERHKDLTIFFDTEVDEKSFPNWTMAFKDLEQFDQKQLSEFQDLINTEDLSQLKPSASLDFFMSIKDDL